MRNLYLDQTTHDLAIQNFNLRFTSNLTEFVSQKIENVLSTFEGEWFLDEFIGIPYFDRILIKQVDLNDANTIFLKAINSIDEIQEILEFNTTYDGTSRTYTVEFKVIASDGVEEETIDGSVPIGGR